MKEKKEQEQKAWRDGVYLCTANSSFEADIFESKLRSEGIPCVKKFKGAANYLEIFMGANVTYPIELYVPEAALEDAQNIIVAVPILGDEIPEEDLEFIGEDEDQDDE